MKICIISNLYPPFIRGGAEVVAAMQADGLKEAWQHVFVISTRPSQVKVVGNPILTSGAMATTVDAVGGIDVYRFNPNNIYYYLNFITLTVFVFTVAVTMIPILYCFSTIFTELTQIIITTSNVANIAPANVDITGFEQPKVNISVVDKSQPNDDGWCQGSISYSGANLGSHHIYLDISVIITGHRIDTIQVTNNPYNLLNGDIGYLTCLLSPENAYVFHFFWDINDNGAHDDGEPRDIETPIEISPGLPTIVNAELN